MLTRDFITPWVICLFDPRCTSGSDYHGHCPRIGGHGKHTSSVQAAKLSGWYPLMIVISSLVERAIMIGSQAPFLRHLYHILRVVSSHWLVSKGGKVWIWTLGRVERCYSAETESIQGHSNNLQAESKNMVKLLLDGRTRIKQVNIQQLDMNEFPELSWFGMLQSFQLTRRSSKRSTCTPCMLRLAKILIILRRFKNFLPNRHLERGNFRLKTTGTTERLRARCHCNI